MLLQLIGLNMMVIFYMKFKGLALPHISIENVGRDGILVYIIHQAEHSASHLVQ